MNEAEALGFLIGAAIGFVVFGVGPYMFMAYVLTRVGRKFGVGSFGAFCVPVYNTVLLCRCANLSGWFAAGFWGFVLALLAPELWLVVLPAAWVTGVYVWGTLARRLGKNFWAWGLGCTFLGIPTLILAFDSSTPVATVDAEDEVTYDARFDDDDSYASAPIPELVRSGAGAPLLVRFLTGEYAGQEFELPHDGIVIGRDPAGSNVVFSASEVSARHVQVSMDVDHGGRLVITDLGSLNGTYIQQPAGGETGWTQVHGSYTAAPGVPCRIRLGTGVAEIEIA